MSLIPAFELGLWNAWIFILPLIFISIFGSKILGKRETEESSGDTEKGKKAINLYFSIVLLSYAYSIFLPIKLNTIWFAISLIIYLPILTFLIIGLINLAASGDRTGMTLAPCLISNLEICGARKHDIELVTQ